MVSIQAYASLSYFSNPGKCLRSDMNPLLHIKYRYSIYELKVLANINEL